MLSLPELVRIADALRAVQERIWVESVLAHPALARGMQKLTPKTREYVVHWLNQAA